MRAEQRIPRCIALTLLCLSWVDPVAAFPSQATQRSRLQRPTLLVVDRHPNHGLPSRDSSRLQAAGGLLNLFAKPPPPPPPPLSKQAVFNAQIRELAKHSTLMGTVRTIFAKFRITPKKWKLIVGGISQAVHWEELLFFYFVGWMFVPMISVPQTLVRERFFPQATPFKRSYTKVVADQFAQASRIGFVVYLVDILKLVLQAMGFKLPLVERSPHIVAQALGTWWLVNRVANLKRYILAIQTRNDPGDLFGAAELVDRLADAVLYGLGAFILITNLQTEGIGAATKGVAALGGLSTILISLSTQGLLTQVFYGLFLAASSRIRKGDVVRFGDLKGLIVSLGWTETLIRGTDGVMISVPNKEIVDKPVRNLSRVTQSSVKQELRFKYSDADKLPKLLEDIKEEIRKACPKLIDDGSRPFRSYWTAYGTMGLEVTVEANFRIKLLGNPFWQNRQNMLVAINKAVKENGMEFAVVDEELLNALYKNVK